MRQYLFLAAFVLSSATAAAHEAPMGWTYGWECCSTTDCRQVATVDVRETKAGYVVKSGEVIPYGDTRIKTSKDEFFHWCTVAGYDDGRTLCLYVPDRGY